MKTTIRLTFEDLNEIDAAEVADFFFLFRAVYTVATILAVAKPALAEQEGFAKAVEDQVQRLKLRGLSPLFHKELGVWRLVPKHIGRHSPFTIDFEGLASALTVAVIFSGGRIKLGSVVEASLPPLAEGIKKLRETLSPSPGVTFRYDARIKTIKLSVIEYDELMRLSPRGKGGFQTLVQSLQRKVDRKTRELTLTTDELDRLFRYAENPKKGGWQASIQKIFGRHFTF